MAKKKQVKRKASSKSKKRKTSNFSKTISSMYKSMTERIGQMTIFIIILVILFVLLTIQLQRQQEIDISDFNLNQQSSRDEFVQTIAPTAQQLQTEYGVLASVSMAQAMLESEFGQSELASEHNNLYGVKTSPSDPEGVDYVTSEFVDNEWVEIVDRFKVYPNWDASMRAHAELLYYGTSWDSEFYEPVISADTPSEQAKGLQEAGYATDPDYANKLINLINQYDLQQYDLVETASVTPNNPNQPEAESSLEVND
ncbi:glycoside hydrolase family 73 protein [Fundicoccus culcitae]|uniref:Glycoside hydrolase family 73 protein n=1 Tax=Fundicoccus culcitae TaxID=2969821 RepID=A0ABY5P4Z0_9LACT|nr:glycoside hydrolase family 73 protein [Fundicoccus culcitae]UUX33821.1 glycoside hydrolase family 73 protein [Fundicoccus culcitae]